MPGQGDLPQQGDPATILAGRDILVPITDASITYDVAGVKTTEEHETILVNRARAAWMEIQPEVEDDDDDAATPKAADARTRYVKDFTGTVAD